MLKFNNGYFGACICVLALLGTAISGFVLNVDQESREVTKYSYVADVSGLFSYSDAPEYISYNPSTNYTGYTPLSNVDITPSSTANNYSYILADGTTSTLGTATITNSTDYGSDYVKWAYTDPNNPNELVGVIATNESSVTLGGNEKIWPIWANHETNIPTLKNVLDAILPDISGYATIEIELTYSNSVSPVFFYAGDWQYTRSVLEVPPPVGNIIYNNYNTTFTDAQLPDKLVLDKASNLISAYRNDELLWKELSINVGVFNKYYVPDSGDSPNVSRNTTVDLSIKGVTYPTYGYMNPKAGVRVVSPIYDFVTWSNGYQNSVVDLKIIKDGDYPSNYQGVYFKVNNSLNERRFDVSYNYNTGHFHYRDILTGTVDLGTWLGVGIRIDGLSGKVIVTPTNDVDLTKSVEPTEYSIVSDSLIIPGEISEISVTRNADKSLKFNVTDTMVFLNTYNTVMIDPSLEVSDYFPNLDDYRLNFYSFAVMGDSITINGQTCPVNRDNGTFTFENVAGFEFTKKLENFYITQKDGNTILTFVNDGSEYDLGETTDTEVSFDGMWYFVTGLWDSYIANETFWNWDLSGFQATAGECLLIFLGIIGAGVIIYIVWGKGKLGFLDWLVIIFAVFLASAFLGF